MILTFFSSHQPIKVVHIELQPSAGGPNSAGVYLLVFGDVVCVWRGGGSQGSGKVARKVGVMRGEGQVLGKQIFINCYGSVLRF